MAKHEPKSERKAVNDAVQYWVGFTDALEWCMKIIEDEELEKKYEDSKELIQIYRERLHSIMLEEGRRKKK